MARSSQASAPGAKAGNCSSRVGVTPDAYADQLVRSGTVPLAVADVLRGKALAFVLEHAAVTDASGREVDLNQLERDAAEQG